MNQPRQADRDERSTPVNGVLCPGCKSAIPENFRYCSECGLKVDQSSRVRAVPTVIAQSEAVENPVSETHASNVDGHSSSTPQETPKHAPGADESHEFRCGCGATLARASHFCNTCGKPANGSPATPCRLVVRTLQGRRGVHPLNQTVTVGTGDTCSLRISDDTHLSRQHARFHVVGDALVLEDLMSSNGTFVRVRSPFLIRVGDEILVGGSVLRVEEAVPVPPDSERN